MGFFEAIILGLVQGLTEFLPISSSAHLRIVGEFLPGAADPGATFTAITQLGTELAVIMYFRRRIGSVIAAWFRSLHPGWRERARTDPLVKLGWIVILGTIPIDVVDVSVRVLRPGRTIELVEATLAHAGRPAVIGRVWMMATRDTAAVSGGALPAMPHPEEMELWQPSDVWDGAFVGSVDIVRREEAPGRAQAWLRPQLPLLDSEPVSTTARALGVLDVANGIATRLPPTDALYPNLDLTAHLAGEPRGEWIGLDTTVTFGSDGVGLTHSIIHDETGPIGALEQILTVRQR